MKENVRGFRREVERAVRFIGENLDRPILLAEVAKAAHLSPFHFHRVFHAVVGESVGKYITRRRLELAALRLAYETDRSITDIALSSGYSSSSNFTKAFSARFGCSPSQVRTPERQLPHSVGQLTRAHGRSFRAQDLSVLPPEGDIEEQARQAASWRQRMSFVDAEALPFACLASPAGYNLDAVQATWDELIRMGRELGLCADAVDAWGVVHDSPQVTAPELCRYHACIPDPRGGELPTPLFRGQRVAGRYAVFRYAGPVTGIEEAYRSIYTCWFPLSSLAPDDLQPLEHYVTDEPKDGQVDLELWLKVRPRR